MTLQQSAQLLFETADKGKNSYHPHYQKTVDYAKDCKAYFAGVNLDEYLKPFARRESKDLFDQRKAITAHINKSVGAALMRPFQKVPRSNWTKVLAFGSDSDGRRAQQFEREVLAGFYRGGLDRYVFERMLYWSIFDPNAFLVVEFDSTDGRTRAKPYPFEVTADMAVRYKFDKFGTMQYLVSRQAQDVTDTKGHKQNVERLTLYQPLQTVVLQQLTDEQAKALPVQPVQPPKIASITVEPQDGDLVRTSTGSVYRFEIPFPHGYDKCPAFRAGYAENPDDDGKTRVSIFDAAMPFCKKLVKTNSEFDLTAALLAFPVSVRYEERCEQPGCLHGSLADGTKCTTCHGTGYKPRPTSAAEELVLAMPSSPEDMMDVSKVMTYIYPPTDAVKMQADMLQSFVQQAKEAVFNSQMFTKQEVAQTATYHGIELQSIYDTLHPWAKHIGSAWTFVCECCQAFTGFAGDMTAALIFPQDFRFETAEQLFAELKSARDAGAGTVVTDVISSRIIDRMLVDDPEMAAEVRAEMRLDPFAGMSEAAIQEALVSNLVPRWKKVYYANRKDILLALEIANPAFFSLPIARQMALVKEEAEKIMQDIEAEQPAISFNFPGLEPQPNAG